MRRRFVIILAVFAVAVFVLWGLYGGRLIGGLCEVLFEQAAGGPVDIGNADVSLGGGRLVLSGLCVGDRHNGQRNLLEAEGAVFDVLVAELLKGRLHIEQLSLRGVRFGTPRKVTTPPPKGVLEQTGKPTTAKKRPKGETVWQKARKWVKDKLGELPASHPEGLVQQLDPRMLVEQGELDSLLLLKRKEEDLKSWVKGVESEAGKLRKEVADIKMRCEALRKKSRSLRKRRDILKAIKETQRLMKDVSRLKKSVDAFEKRLKAGGNFSSVVADFNAALEKDIDKLRQRYTFGGFKAVNMAKFLFGERLVETGQKLWWWGRLLWRYMPRPRRSVVRKRGWLHGEKIRIVPKDKMPALLLRKVLLDADLSGCEGVPQELRGRFGCVAENISSAPRLYGKPLLFTLTRGDKGGKVKVVFRVEPRAEHQEVSVVADVEALPIKGVKFGPHNLRLVGYFNVDAHLTGTAYEDGVVFEMTAQASNVRIKPAEKVEERLLGVVASTLSRLRSFTLKARVRVSREKVDVYASSSLDREVGRALEAELRGRFEEMRKRFESSLRSAARKRLDGFLKRARSAVQAVLQKQTSLVKEADALGTAFSRLFKSLRKKAAKSFLEKIVK